MRKRETSSASKTTLLLLVALAMAPSACGGGSSGTDPVFTGAGGAPAGFGGASTAGASGVGPGAGGAGGALMFSSGGSAGAAACLMTAATCARASDCCGNSVCNTNTPAAELFGCRPACATGADCPSGCCVPYGAPNSGFCADAKWCACGGEGNACGSMLPACCAAQLCVGGGAAGADVCKTRCTANADCSTSCCVPITGTGVSVCLDPMYCPQP